MLPARPGCPFWKAASRACRTAVLALAVTAAGPALAQEDSRWNVSGYGTAGVTSQSGAEGWRFLRNSAQAAADGRTSATPDSRAGLQLNWSRGPQWDAALQVVAMKKPPGAPLSDSLEWAYLSHRPDASWRLRLGRINPDLFLYADSRNVGYGLPWARPPVDFYGFAPLAAVDGLDVERQWSSGDGEWRGRLTAGSFSISGIDTRGQRFGIRGRETLALGLSREEGGLLLKASYLRTRLAMGAPPELLLLRDGLSQLAALPVPGLAHAIGPLQHNLWIGGPVSYRGFGAQYERGPWTIAAEASDLSVPGSPLNARRGYVSLGYRHKTVTYFALASRVVPRKPAPEVPDLMTPLTPVIGAPAAAAAQQLAGYAGAAAVLYRYDQSTVGAGLRWDLLPNAAVKLQVDRFKVHANGSAGWVHGDGRAARGTLYSVVFDFVWGQ